MRNEHKLRGVGAWVASPGMPELDRRRFLAAAGALSVLPATHRRSVTARAQPAAAPFSWGVASFDPTPDGVLLWTRAVADDGGRNRLSWLVAADPALDEVVARGEVTTDEATDHCAVVTVELEPDRTWWYAFTTAGGARSPVGRTRTLPATSDRAIRLGVASCSRFASGGFAAYRALAEREIDVVVHVGDYIYEDGRGGKRPHEPTDHLVAVEHYRTRYAQHRADPDLQALHARHPMVAVWDDHEVAGNAWRDGAVDHDDDVDGPWLDRLLAAGQAREEWVPGRTHRGDADGRLQAWRHLSLGPLAELVVLDTRTWGRDRQPRDSDELATDGRTMLGADQEAFVAERLQRAGRPPWVVLANQVMLHPLRVPVPTEAIGAQLEDGGFLVDGADAVNPDQWDGYAQARDALVAAAGTAGGVLVLTGDVHSSWAWEGPALAGQQARAMVEVVTPSITSEPFADRLPVPPALVETALRQLDEDLSYVELSSHGYVIVELEPDGMQAEWWHVDPADPGSQRFAAARRTPRAAPMELTEVAEPRPDPAPTTTAAPATTTSTEAPVADAPRGSDGSDLPLVGGAVAAVVAAATGGLVALRRRRDPR